MLQPSGGRCCLNSKRNSNRLNLSFHAKVRFTHRRNEWMAALNNRFRPRFGVFRLRGYSLMFGMSPALVMPGIKPAIEIEIGTVDLQIGQSGHALQGIQSLWQEYG
jgi:hypothetical protein